MRKIINISLLLLSLLNQLYAQETPLVEEKPEDEIDIATDEQTQEAVIKLEAKTKYIKIIKEYYQSLEQINQEQPSSFDDLEKDYSIFLEEYRKLKIDLPQKIREDKIEDVADYLEKIKLAIKNLELRQNKKIDFLNIYKNKIKNKIPIYEKIIDEYTIIQKENIQFDEDISSIIGIKKTDESKKNKDKFDNTIFLENQVKELKLKITNGGLLILEIDKIIAEWTDESFNFKNKMESLAKKRDILSKKIEYLKIKNTTQEELKQINDDLLRLYEKKNSEFEASRKDILKRKENIEKLRNEYKDDYLKNLSILEKKTTDENQYNNQDKPQNQTQKQIIKNNSDANKNDQNSDIKDELYEKEKYLNHEIKQIEDLIRYHTEKKAFAQKYMTLLQGYLKQFDEFLVEIDQHIKVSIYHQELEKQAILFDMPILPGVEFFTKLVQSKSIQVWIDDLIDQYFMLQEISIDIKKEYEKLEFQIQNESKQTEILSNKLIGENGLNEQLKKNKELNEFVKDLEKLNSDELLKVYDQNKKDFDHNLEKEKEIRQRYQEISVELAKFLEDRKLKLSDPILRQFAVDVKDDTDYMIFAKQTMNLFKNIKEENTKTENQKTEKTENQQKKIINPLINTSENQSTPSPLIENKIFFNEHLRAKLPPRLTFYEEYQKSKKEYLSILKKREQLIIDLLNLQKSRSDIIKQLWRSATMLYRRYAGFESEKISAIKKEIEPFQKESWTKQAELKNIEELQVQQLKDQAWYQLEPNFEEMLKPLNTWEKELDHLIHLIRNKDELSQKKLIKSEEEMTPTEKSKKEHDLIERMEKDEYWYEWIWEFIPSDHTENIDKLLKNLYSELLDYENKQKHLIKQNKYLKESITSLEKQRDTIESISNLVKNTMDIYAQRLEMEKNRLLLSIDPNQEKFISKNSDSKIIDDRFEIKTEEQLQAKLESIKLYFYYYQRYQNYLYEFKKILEPQGYFDSSLGLLRDQSAQLDTEIDRLNDPIKRLIGIEEFSDQVENQENQTKAKKLKKGEIYKTRDSRLKEKLKGLFKTIFLLLFIPILAIFISRSFNSIGQKILDYVKKEQDPNANAVEVKEKEERASTLFHVSKTLINIIIMMIAFIYILKAINVDVTPIIASAGVLGLALAFGSQALVKDFFAGFFILLENQYNIGDIVKINSIQGKIEQITLRLTIVRDIEGIVHFIPNGSISMVSNCNKGWAQARIEVGVGYQNSPEKVLACLKKVVESFKNNEEYKNKIINMEAMGIERFDDSAVIYRIHIQVIPGEQWELARLCRIMIMNQFKEEGIDIPYPQLVIHKALAEPKEILLKENIQA